MKRIAAASWTVSLAVLPCLLLAGCGESADETTLKSRENTIALQERRMREKDQKIRELEAEIVGLKNQLRAIQFAARSPGATTQSAPATAAEREAQLARMVTDYCSALYFVRNNRTRSDSPVTVIAGEGGEQVAVTAQSAYEPGKGLRAGIFTAVLTDRFLPPNIKGKTLVLDDFDMVGIDSSLDIAVGVLPVKDGQITAPPLGDESKMARGFAVYHIGWPTRDARPPNDAQLANAHSEGQVAALPAEEPDGLLKVVFHTSGLYTPGDPVFDETGHIVGFVQSVNYADTGATVLCTPASKVAAAVQKLTAARRKIVAGTFDLEEKVKSMLLTDDGKYLVGISTLQDAVYVFNADDGKLVKTLPTDPTPVDVAECSGKLFVTSKLGQNVTMFDLAQIEAAQAIKPLKVALPYSQPGLIATPAGGRGEWLYVLAGTAPSQAILPVSLADFTPGADVPVIEPFYVKDLPQGLGSTFSRGPGVVQMRLSPDGALLYLVADGAKPPAVVLRPLEEMRLVRNTALAGPVLYVAPYGGMLLAGGQVYNSDLQEAANRADGFLACFQRSLPYFVTFLSRGRAVIPTARQLQELNVDVMSVYPMGQEAAMATLALPSFRTTWSMLAASGKLYMVNHVTSRCVVLETDAKSLSARAPNPIVNAPRGIVWLGEEFEFTPKPLRPKAPGDTFTVEGMPAGMHMDPDTGKMTWKPTPEQLKPATIDLRLKPASGIETRLVFQVNVLLKRVRLQTPTGGPLTHLTAGPQGRTLFALAPDSNAVVLIDAISLKELRRIPVGTKPVDCGWRQDKLYVLCQGAKSINVLDPAEGKVTEQFALTDVAEPFAMAVNSGPTIFVGHSTFKLLAISATNPSRVQETVQVRRKNNLGRWGQYEDFNAPFISLASDARGQYLAVQPEQGRFALFTASGAKLSLEFQPEDFPVAAAGLVQQFLRQTAVSYLDGTRRRWYVRNRVYDLRGSTPRATALSGELSCGSPDWDRFYSLGPGQQRADNSNAFTSVLLTIYAADDMRELVHWDLPYMTAYGVLEVEGGLALFNDQYLARIPIDLKALLAPPAAPTSAPTPAPPPTGAPGP